MYYGGNSKRKTANKELMMRKLRILFNHHPKTPAKYVCKKCNKEYESQKWFKKHEQKHTKDEKVDKEKSSLVI